MSDMISVRITLDYLTEEQVEELVRLAIIEGYKREHPRKPWKNREYRMAINWYGNLIMQRQLEALNNVSY